MGQASRYTKRVASSVNEIVNTPEQKAQHQASDYLPWNDMLVLVQKLFRDENYVFSAYIATGCATGLRVSDLKRMTWGMVLDNNTFTLKEQKTGKKRTIKVNSAYKEHIQKCYDALKVEDKNLPMFISRKLTVYSTQRLNVCLKEIAKKYNLKSCPNFSNHSLRKCFGRRVVEQAGEQAEMALIKLSEIFSHSSPQITRLYLGLRHQELMETYDLLDF